MNVNKLKTLALIVGTTMLIGVFGGCGQQTGTQVGSNGSEITYNGDKIYPVECDDTLTYWMGFTDTSGTVTNFGETPLAKKIAENTGVKVKYIHSQAGQETEQFNIMLASDELPDVVQYAWNNYAGGPDKAISDKYIIKLNDVLDKYAPNVKKYFKDNLELERQIKTDAGNYYSFPFVRGDDILTVSSGLILRNDWLKKVNLKTPETIDEWTTVLTAFKDKCGSSVPLTLISSYRDAFMAAYNIAAEFYLDNGQVKYGPAEMSYKGFLKTFREWYAAGLLDNNMASIDSKMIDSSILTGKSGAAFGWAGSSLGAWLQAAKNTTTATDVNFDLVAAPYPVLNKGIKPEFGKKDNRVLMSCGSAISSKCKNVELAARLLDYGYSEAGHNLYNFGIEGESFNWVNGYPKYTELITKNPKGLTMNQSMTLYMRSNSNGIMAQDKRYVEQYYEKQQQKDALTTWSNTNMDKHLMPPVTLLTEESAESADILNNVKTYTDEMFIRFVNGSEPIENFDKYIAQLRSFGLDKVIAMKQSALKRYNER